MSTKINFLIMWLPIFVLTFHMLAENMRLCLFLYEAYVGTRNLEINN